MLEVSVAHATPGIVTTPFPSKSVSALAVQNTPLNDILVVGTSGGTHFALARYSYTGQLDPSLGGNGKVAFAFGTKNVASQFAQARQTIVVVGSGNDSKGCKRPLLMRFKIDGTLDSSFSGNGGLYSSFSGCSASVDGSIDDVKVDPISRIVIVGQGGDGHTYVVRYDWMGNLDTNFGVGGKVDVNAIVAATHPSDVWLDSLSIANGNILLAGRRRNATDASFLFVRLLDSGAPDGSFGTAGVVVAPPSYPGQGVDTARWAQTLSDGRIVAVGGTFINSLSTFVVIMRLSSSGVIDTNFGANPLQWPFQSHAEGMSGALDSGGRLLVGAETDQEEFLAIRFTTAGTLDTTFNSPLGYRAASPGTTNHLHGIAVDENESPVMCGDAINGSEQDIGLARFTVTGAVDNTFHN